MLKSWQIMPIQKRLIVVASVLATILALYALVKVTLKPKMDLLYAGLDPAAAGEVIAKLDGLDVPYQVRGGAIYTDALRRDALRLELAREGMPRQSVVGYELFDDVNSFAMTSEMFDTAYWRAKEGELSRTILAMPNIQTARVHLGVQKTSGFSRADPTKSASVTVTSSGSLTPQQAKAIQYLTALSVSGLEPNDIAVIDTQKGLIAGPGLEPDNSEFGDGELERAASIKKNLLSLLEARVGVGNARVNVSLELDRDRESSVERTFDPDGRVLKSQTTSEVNDTSRGSTGAVTVASNLPEGDAGGGGTNSANRSQTDESVSYEVSELVRNREKMPGAITRMTIAVLVNDQISYGETGEVIREPRTAEELSTLQELVQAAAGLNVERGDELTVKNLSFEQPNLPDALVKPGMWEKFLDQYLGSVVQSGILAIVVLALGLFVVRPMLRGSANAGEGNAELMPLSLQDNSDFNAGSPDSMVDVSPPALASSPAIAGHLDGPTNPDPIETLKSMAAEKPEDSASLLSAWLDDDDAVAGAS